MGDRISKPNDVPPDVPFTKWTQPVAKGSFRGAGDVRCNVSFDEDTFAEIRALAIKNHCAFSAMVRLLVEWGLETAEENKLTR